jgi:hypothetical protein
MSTTPSSQPTTPWPRARSLLFRFAVCYTLLYYNVSLLTAIPGLSYLLAPAYTAWNHLLAFLGLVLFNLGDLTAHPRPTGSGDTALAYISQSVTIIMAVLATTLWSLLDRKRNAPSRNAYPRLAVALSVFARYNLAVVLLSYAVYKLIPVQFHPLNAHALAEPYGQSTPMALLWNFMGFSPAYTIFGGLAELIPALLLCFRRTAPLGALLAAAVLTNIVMLNFCYDVPVKLYSLNLLALAIALILPHARTLVRFFTGHPAHVSTPSLPWLQRASHQRGLLIAKAVVLVLLIAKLATGSLVIYFFMQNLPTPPPTPLTTTGFHWLQEKPNIH